MREYTLNSLRSQIAMVLQPPLIFPLSVRRQHRLWPARRRPRGDRERRAAGAHPRHDRAHAARATRRSSAKRGVALSEGEKQRITIARALLRDAPILILDEPTSALDVETEALVMEAIERLMEGRTTFIIAHRLSTVRRCDRILVLRDGTIAEQGSFAELLRRGGIFAEYYRTQFAPGREGPGDLRPGLTGRGPRPGVAFMQLSLLRNCRSILPDSLEFASRGGWCCSPASRSSIYRGLRLAQSKSTRVPSCS